MRRCPAELEGNPARSRLRGAAQLGSRPPGAPASRQDPQSWVSSPRRGGPTNRAVTSERWNEAPSPSVENRPREAAPPSVPDGCAGLESRGRAISAREGKSQQRGAARLSCAHRQPNLTGRQPPKEKGRSLFHVTAAVQGVVRVGREAWPSRPRAVPVGSLAGPRRLINAGTPRVCHQRHW